VGFAEPDEPRFVVTVEETPTEEIRANVNLEIASELFKVDHRVVSEKLTKVAVDAQPRPLTRLSISTAQRKSGEGDGADCRRPTDIAVKRGVGSRRQIEGGRRPELGTVAETLMRRVGPMAREWLTIMRQRQQAEWERLDEAGLTNR